MEIIYPNVTYFLNMSENINTKFPSFHSLSRTGSGIGRRGGSLLGFLSVKVGDGVAEISQK